MKYEIKATQIICKYIYVDAQSESDAFEKAQKMVEDNEIHFDDEPYLNMDIQIEVLKWEPNRH